MSVFDPLLPFWEAQKLVILDGGLATELEKRGADLRDELWSARMLIEDPAAIRRLHFDYFVAGADVATSASYQATFEAFKRRGLGRSESDALMKRSVRLAQEARDHFWEQPERQFAKSERIRPLVAASVGSYGAFLADGSEYRGEYGLCKRALKEWHRPRLETLLAAGPDLLACETIPCRDEGEALCELLDEYEEARAWMSFSCLDGAHVCNGDSFAQCVALAGGSTSIVAVGLNCTDPRFAESLLRSAQTRTTKPLVCYPNSGERWDSSSASWQAANEVGRFPDRAGLWREAGALLIGGCCRTSPQDIRELRSILLDGG